MSVRKYVILSLLLILSQEQALLAQERALVVQSKRNADKSVELTYDKKDPGTFTIQFIFKELDNASMTKTVYSVKDYSGVVTTLKPLNKDKSIAYSYTYSSIRGKLNPKVNNEIIYSLPYSAGVRVSSVEANFLNATYFGNNTPDDWKAYSMTTDKQEVVTAARKGLVVQVDDLYEDSSQEGISYSNKRNTVIIEHEDGTLAYYAGLSKGSFQVKVGETVFPGSQLAKNTQKDGGKYGMTFMITYLKVADMEMNKGKNLSTTKSYYGFVTPQFLLQGQRGTLKNRVQELAEINESIIAQELSKRELKQMKKGN